MAPLDEQKPRVVVFKDEEPTLEKVKEIVDGYIELLELGKYGVMVINS